MLFGKLVEILIDDAQSDLHGGFFLHTKRILVLTKPVLKLKEQAFLQVACSDTRGIETLNFQEDLLDFLLVRTDVLAK